LDTKIPRIIPARTAFEKRMREQLLKTKISEPVVPGMYISGVRVADVNEVRIEMTRSESPRMTLESAIALAARLHNGQKDLAGEPYILHPLRVMSKFKTYEARMVAILHDVVEDTKWTMEDIENVVTEPISTAVNALTRRKGLGESYQDYLYRVRDNYYALAVKVEDLKDNLDMNRLSPEQVVKYKSLFKRESRALHFCLMYQTYSGVL
jgi:(p)ppGpp synthase/HD superfamily hydrolase